MGKLECLRCGAVVLSDDFKEAMDNLDHAIGLHNGRPCPNDMIGNTVLWNGVAVPKDRSEPKTVNVTSTPTEEPKKTRSKK